MTPQRGEILDESRRHRRAFARKRGRNVAAGLPASARELVDENAHYPLRLTIQSPPRIPSFVSFVSIVVKAAYSFTK
jgi:hypothetical protein